MGLGELLRDTLVSLHARRASAPPWTRPDPGTEVIRELLQTTIERPSGLRCSTSPSRYPAAMELPFDLDDLRGLLRQHGIAFAVVFGSHSEGRARAESDVDLAVWSPGTIDEWRLRSELPEPIDLVNIHGAPEGLAGRIALTGVVVLDDDPPRRIRWQAQTRKRYLDEAGRRERFRRDFVAAHG